MRRTISVFILLLVFRSMSSAEDRTVVQVRDSVQYQKIDNFGASDCWTFRFLGENWPVAVREKVADLLFSKEFEDNGNPKGIGLSLWRFNIGAGSADTPTNTISNEWRTTECFADSSGILDFTTRQAGQVWFLKAAKERGCDKFLGFCNSAPWFMTRNRQAYNFNGRKDTYNMDHAEFCAFANFLSEVWRGLRDTHGIKLDYISPFNEPEWDWTQPGQEGSPASVSDISAFVRVLGDRMERDGITATIIFPESGAYNYLYSEEPSRDWIDRQIYSFFDESSPYYIGDVYGVENLVAAHSYWTTHAGQLVPVRERVASEIAKYGLRLWQSELCIMSNDTEIGGGPGRDMGMNTALYVARVIHHDLVTANASAWQWWTAVSPEDYKDGLLFVDKDTRGTERLYIPKLLWSLGSYSRFIRPGAVRIWAGCSNGNVLASSYVNEDGSYVIVLQNHSCAPSEVLLDMKRDMTFRAYITSDAPEDNMRYMGEVTSSGIIMPERSIITLVGIQ